MFGIFQSKSVDKMVDEVEDALDAAGVFKINGRKVDMNTFAPNGSIDSAALGRAWSALEGKYSKSDWQKIAAHWDKRTTSANAGRLSEFVRHKLLGSKNVVVR